MNSLIANFSLIHVTNRNLLSQPIKLNFTEWLRVAAKKVISDSDLLDGKDFFSGLQI